MGIALFRINFVTMIISKFVLSTNSMELDFDVNSNVNHLMHPYPVSILGLDGEEKII